MLAAHLQRLARREPVRYAHALDDPAMLQALQNFLRLNLRSMNAGLAHQHAMTHPAFAEAQTPDVQGAWQSLMDQAHPADLMAYLDLLRSSGIEGPQRDRPRANSDLLLHRLGMLHAGVTDQMQYPNPHITRAYSQEALQHPDLSRSLLEYLGRSSMSPAAMRLMPRWLGRAVHPEHPHAASLVNDVLHGGNVNSLVRMYDLAHRLTSPERPESAFSDRMAGARTAASNVIGQHVIPTLEDYGREGRFPQS